METFSSMSGLFNSLPEGYEVKKEKRDRKRKRKLEKLEAAQHKALQTESPAERPSDFDRIFGSKSSPAMTAGMETAPDTPTGTKKQKKQSPPSTLKDAHISALDVTNPAAAGLDASKPIANGVASQDLLNTAVNYMLKLETAFTKMGEQYAILSADFEKLREEQHNLTVQLAAMTTALFEMKNKQLKT